MAKTNIFVWHNATGQIVAVGRPMGKHKATPLAGENQFVLQTEIDEAHIKGLHRSHIVDANGRALVKHPRPQTAPER
jgi:hypothetical protein